MTAHAEEQLREEVAHLRKLLQDERKVGATLLAQLGHIKSERDSLREMVERLKSQPSNDDDDVPDGWENF